MKSALWLTASLLFGLSTLPPMQQVRAAEPERPSDHDVFPPREEHSPHGEEQTAPHHDSPSESSDSQQDEPPRESATPVRRPLVPPKSPPPVKTSPTPVDHTGPSLGAPVLRYEFPEVMEGRRATIQLRVDNANRSIRFPIKGTIQYEDATYDRARTETIKKPFTLQNAQAMELELLFRSSGRKKVVIETESQVLPTRNVALFVQAFPATVFPRSVDSSAYDKNPANWHAFVNLYYSNVAGAKQRQYYMVTYKGEIQQRLLTSAATPGRVTPQGKFKLGTKMANPRSTRYASLMPFWTTLRIPGYTYEYGNHGLIGESYLYLLGRPASHGCLRLSNKVVRQQGKAMNIGGARWVYTHVPEGTPIHIFRRPAQPFDFENYRTWLARR